MNWIHEAEAKPTKWEIVTARCENSSGETVELDAYWTGQYWRIIGEKSGVKRLKIKTWSSKTTPQSQ